MVFDQDKKLFLTPMKGYHAKVYNYSLSQAKQNGTNCSFMQSIQYNTTLVEVDFGKKQKTCHIMQLKRSSLRVVLTSPLLLLNLVTPLQ